MSILIASDALAPLVSPAVSFIPPALPSSAEPNQIRHMLFGNLATVQAAIRHLYKLGYAEVNDWSPPVSTGRPHEVMAILTKRVKSERG